MAEKHKATTVIAFFLCLLSGSSYSMGWNITVNQDDSLKNEIIIGKAFYLLAIIKKDNDLRDVVKSNSLFKSITIRKANALKTSASHCKDVTCYATLIQWNQNEIQLLGRELVYLYQTNKSFKKLPQLLKESGNYKVYEHLTDTAFIRSAWENTAQGMNNVTDVYLKGEKPRFPLIDSMSFHVNDTTFRKIYWEAGADIIGQYAEQNALFFELPLRLTLKSLEINGRDEASRYEPLNSGWNMLPFERIGTVDWGRYKYSVILVPGQGPKDPAIVLDSVGIYRLKLAVKSYKEGLAPFIVVSGGNVHPYKTPFNEAVEMKKYLIDSLATPENAVFIEPHARHTTTNLRNTSRMIYHFGMPSQKPILITTSSGQNAYINEGMSKRVLNELGYLPHSRLKKLDIEKSEFYPVMTVLQADPLDILDP